jgi:alcohol dehydrogenase class IV
MEVSVKHNTMNGPLETIELELRKFVAPEYVFGTGARLMAAVFCKKLGGRKVLLVTDEGVKKTPWFEEAKGSLQTQGIEYEVFSSISPNPRDYEVMQGAEVYRENKCNLLLALGGGSVMDCAKGIGIVSSNHSPITNFEGVDKIGHPIPPLVCIPSTGGTAADVSQFAIINNWNEKYKMAIISKAVVPDVALIDPMVLTSMDNFLTACTGMDALSHAFEAYASNASSAFTDLYALEAIRLIEGNLFESIQMPNDIQLRGKIMLASLYAGLAFSNASLGCVHSMAHSLGGYLDLPHGECNAILLPHVVDFNFDSAIPRYSRIAETMNLPISGLTPPQIKKNLIAHILEFKQKLNIPSTLQDKGVTSDMIPALSAKAIKDPCNATNPKSPVKKDLERIYSEAM